MLRPRRRRRYAVSALNSQSSSRAVLARSLAWALPALVFAAACKSPEEYAAAADREVAAIVEARRREIFADPTVFSIQPLPESLRARVLSGEVTDLGVVDLRTCLEIAAESNRDYWRSKERLYLAALDLTLERYRFRRRPLAFLSGEISDSGPGGADANLGANGAYRRTLGTGAEIVGTLGASLFRSISTSDGWQSLVDFGLGFTQPLLRGRGQRIVQEPLTQAERTVIYEVRGFERFRRTLAVDVTNSYFQILRQLDVIRNSEENLSNLTLIRERNENLANAGRLSDVQVDQARQDEFLARDRLILSRQNYENQLDDFKFFLGLPIDVTLALDPSELDRFDGAAPPFTLDAEPLARVALEERLDLQTQADRVVDAQRGVYIAENAFQAGIDLAGSFNASGSGSPFKIDNDDVSWRLGLLVDLPADRFPERNVYRSALIVLRDRLRLQAELGDQIVARIREDARAARRTRQTFEIQQNAVRLAERRVESATLNLDAGRATTRDLLESQEALFQTQNALTRSLIEYHLTMLDLLLDLEAVRVTEEGIVFDDELLETLKESTGA